MSEHENLTVRDPAEPRRAGDETAEDMPLTREDHPRLMSRLPSTVKQRLLPVRKRLQASVLW
jgi:hypothetical protein